MRRDSARSCEEAAISPADRLGEWLNTAPGQGQDYRVKRRGSRRATSKGDNGAHTGGRPGLEDQMHVVHYIPRIRSEEGGVVRAAVDLVSALVGRDCRVSVLTHDPTDAPACWTTESHLEVVRLAEGRSPGPPLRSTDRATALRVLEKADALHLHTPWEIGNLQLARAARRLGLPYVLSVHGMLADWPMAQKHLKKRLYLATVGRRLIGQATFVHFTAGEELEQGRKWLFGAPGLVVPLALDLEPFHSLPGPGLALEAFQGSQRDSHRVLFLSRLHEKKGLERLLEAVAGLRDQGLDCDLIIAGTGRTSYVRGLQAMTTSLRLDDRVRFVGHVVGDLKVSLYQSSDVFVLPTSQENFGLVLPESLACRTPVITTRGVDIWRELEESGSAIIVPARSEELAAAIWALLEDEPRRHEMGERGRRWVFDRLAPEAVVGAYLDLYRRAREASVLVGRRR